jgi:phosphatidylglycerophosphate synthase
MFQKIVENSRHTRSKYLGPISSFLIKIGVTPNMLTTLSLISGLLSVYFLFNNYVLFIIFGISHLILDGFDGVLARRTKETIHGKYFDLITDNLVAVLLLVKLGYFLNDFYPYIIAFLYTIAIFFHVTRDYPTWYLRTSSLAVLAVATFPYFPYQTTLLTIGYLTAGIVAVYSLARQLQFVLKKN